MADVINLVIFHVLHYISIQLCIDIKGKVSIFFDTNDMRHLQIHCHPKESLIRPCLYSCLFWGFLIITLSLPFFFLSSTNDWPPNLKACKVLEEAPMCQQELFTQESIHSKDNLYPSLFYLPPSPRDNAKEREKPFCKYQPAKSSP